MLTKKRMEGTAEAKVEGLKAEIGELEAKLAPPDATRFEKIEVVTRGDVRRAKLYYLRDLRGKKAKIKEKRETVAR